MKTRILDSLEQPTVVQLSANLFAAVFVLMKMVAARHVIRTAVDQRLLLPGGHVVESTSGAIGLGLAYACREHGHPLTIVGDSAIDEGLLLQLNSLGARVIVVDKPLSDGGIQGARLQRLEEMMSRVRDAFWPRQYDNPAAVDAYKTVAPTITDAIPSIDVLVAPVGTGGSATGLTRAFRDAGHPARLVAVDTHHSVLFGQADRKRLLRGLGNSIFPSNLDYSIVDECHWISAADAFYMTHSLYRTHLLDAGPTSGASYMVARWQAERHPGKNVVFLCPDSGERYRRTVHNPQWLATNNVWLRRPPQQPRCATHPSAATSRWSYMLWAGRSLDDLTTNHTASERACGADE
jgi:cysteine synthase A